MMVVVLAVVVAVVSGVVAGVLFGVALSVLPALSAMPVDRYIYSHELLGRRWDPTMPLLVVGATGTEIVLAAVSGPAVRALFLLGATSLLIVSVVSHWGNVPINRRVKGIAADGVPPDWVDPRPLWRGWHLVRTVAAVVAAVVNAIALCLL